MPLNLICVARIAAALLAGLALSGCGGGGGSAGRTQQTAIGPPQIVPPFVMAGEFALHPGFQGQWGLRAIRADRAYENIARANASAGEGGETAPGAGVTIGFIDSGIDQRHPIFAGKMIVEEFQAGGVDETGAVEYSHGTAVASVALGARIDGSPSLHGVAWAADVKMIGIPLESAGGSYAPISSPGLLLSDLSTAPIATDIASDPDIDILNLSIGYEGLIENYDEARLRAGFSRTISVLAQAGARQKKILVWAAGNAHGAPCSYVGADCQGGRVNATSPEVLPGLMVRISELRGHSIAVAAVGEDGEIADFSNRCGIAADWCIAAPGEDVAFAWFGPYEGRVRRGYAEGSGTSLAAPMVSGALAVMDSFFDGQLSNEELVARVFATADKTGRYADRATYGQGCWTWGRRRSRWGMCRSRRGQASGRADSRSPRRRSPSEARSGTAWRARLRRVR